jgi:hypothetical protein
MPRTSIGLSPTATRRFNVGRPKDWQPSIRSQEEVDDLWWDRMSNKGQRGANWLSDLLLGATPEEEAQNAVFSLMPGGMVVGPTKKIAEVVRRSASKSTGQTARPQPTRIQWMANREGGQRIGNQEEIHPLSEELFDKYVRQLLSEDWAFRPFEEYQKSHPDTHIKLLRNLVGPDPTPNWRAMKVGSYDELLPHGESQQWAKDVKSFDDQTAINWSRMSDSKIASKVRRRQREPSELESLPELEWILRELGIR